MLKAKNFRDQIRHRRAEFVLDEEDQADRIVKLKKHTKRSDLHVIHAECRISAERSTDSQCRVR